MTYVLRIHIHCTRHRRVTAVIFKVVSLNNPSVYFGFLSVYVHNQLQMDSEIDVSCYLSTSIQNYISIDMSSD